MFDNTQAADEGWVICECFGSEDGPWQMQRLDERFSTDGDAWLHVVQQAEEGSVYHSEALEFLRRNNPREHAAIRRFIVGGRSPSISGGDSQSL
ncbi:hypothetical protein V5F40_21565 [Xanthobacter sp. DSM 14520]|uniref:hypothetical protein n=1 Tax=Xanthobacter autotrophicus (strain ATCC BAA-1158 / Py2) TaxID=78245 RepID=UPI00372930E4